MKKRNFGKKILYIAFTVLLLAGSFLCFDKTVNASGNGYGTIDSDTMREIVNDYREYEEQKAQDESGKQSENKSKTKSMLERNPRYIIIYFLWMVFGVRVLIYFIRKRNSASKYDDTESSSYEPEPEEYDVTLEPERYESTMESEQSAELIQPAQLEEITEIESETEDTIKEFSSQELKEIVKNLNPEERNKFMEPAKNGKKEEAIRICEEVTGLDLKNAEKIINLKLYY